MGVWALSVKFKGLMHNKKILTWPEYINPIKSEEHKYKLRLIKIDSEENIADNNKKMNYID